MLKSLDYKISDDNIYYVLDLGYNSILGLIYGGKIKFDKKAVIESINKDIKKSKNKPIYFTNNDNNVITRKYLSNLDNYVSALKNNEMHYIDINYLESILNNLDHATISSRSNNMDQLNNTKNLYMILRIINIIKNDRNKEKQGKGLKTITPKQMLSCLPILLAQIRAGNNSAKLKNEITQLLYLLYRSKKISKAVYNNLITTM